MKHRMFSNFDWQTTLSMLLMCSVGIGLLYSAGFDPETRYSTQMEQQFFSMLAGLLAFAVCLFLRSSFWRRFAYFFYGIVCFALGFVLLNGIIAHGSQRWIGVGALRFQPSEFMKIALILALARVFSSDYAPKDGYTLMTLVVPCGVALLPVGLIMLQPDLGTGLCCALIAGTMLLFVGVKFKTLIRLGVMAAVAAVPAWSMLKDYQKKRITTFLSPEADPLGSGYHAIQSKIAVGSGMVTGKGFLQGTQTQLRFLPEQTTDFIFSVLAEEWGFVGSVVVLGLYAYIILHALKVSSRCTDKFSSIMVIGVAAMIFWHVVINISMVIGFAPVVGLTLPLLSYGGSSVVTIMVGFGLIAGVSTRRFSFRKTVY